MTPEQLKASILQYAIQGKLVEQREEEGTAEELYSQIQADKQKLIKEGKIKKEKSLPEIAEDELPFDIPKSWKWVHLNNIASSGLGKTLNKSTDTGEEVKYLCSINVYWEGINLDKVKVAKFDKKSKEKYRLQKGDLLICEGGEAGRSAIWDSDEEMYYQNALHRVRFYGGINVQYMCYVLECYKKNGTIAEYTKGIGIQHLVQASLNSIWLPLPPLEEQHRIVVKIEDILPLVDRYAKSYEKLEHFNAKFPEEMKKSILQYAIMGKLVEQREEEGTAEELYNHIQGEKQKLIKEGKIKKEKALPEISEDEIPFDIPESWRWCYLGDVFSHTAGKALNSKNTNGTKHKYITTSNVYWDHFELNNLKEMYYTEDEIEKYSVEYGDLLVLEGGDVGRSAIWNLQETYCIQNHIHRLRPFINVDVKYFYYVMMCFKLKGDISGKGIGIKGLSAHALHCIYIPLPPLEEQHRIVGKIEELLPYCDRL